MDSDPADVLSTFSRRLDWLSTDVSLPDSYVGLWDWVLDAPVPFPLECPYSDGTHFEYWTTCTNYIGWVLIIAVSVVFGTEKTIALVAGL